MNDYEDVLNHDGDGEPQREIRIGPETITLKNTKSRLDWTGTIENVTDYYNPQSVIWECDGRFYTMSEVCRGYYQSGKKKGQHCFRPSHYLAGYCSAHYGQIPIVDEVEISNASSSESENE